MRLYILLFFALVFNAINGNGQTLKWVYKIGGTGADVSKDACFDKSFNIFDVSVFSGAAVYATTQTIQSKGINDVLLRKSSAFGNFLWYKQIGSRGDENVYEVITDKQNNVYVVGTFTDSLYVGNQYVLSNPENGIATFVLKFDNDGILLWSKSFLSDTEVSGKSIEISRDGYLVVAGVYSGSTEFSAISSHQFQSAGGFDMFVSKLSTDNGGVILVESLGSKSDEYITDLAIDSTNNIVLTGEYRDTLDFDPTSASLKLDPVGLSDIFVMKLTINGGFVWAKSFGSTGVDSGYKLEVDPANSVVITGRYSDGARFGTSQKASRGGTDIYLGKLDANGSVIWLNTYGGKANDQGSTLYLNSIGIIYLGSEFRDTVDFNISTERKNASYANGGADLSILVSNQDGTYNTHYSFGGIANDVINSVIVRPNGEVISIGGFGAVIDFDPSSSVINVFSSGGIDGFLSNVFLCVNPYLKTIEIPNPIVCYNSPGIVKIKEGYLNHATQWSWQIGDCNNITFASGTQLNLPIKSDVDYYIRGWGGCVVNNECKKASLKVHTDTLKYQTIYLCEGDTAHIGDNAYFAAGSYLDSLTTMAGCDSVLVTDIVMVPSYTVQQSIAICQGDTLHIGNNSHYLAGLYMDNLYTVDGCDSIIITNLTLKPAKIENAEAIICKGDSIKVGTETYFTAGKYIQTSINSSGCEDLLIVNIIVLETEFDQSFSLCEGESVTVGTHTYSETGVYTDRFSSSFGCDSIITTTLKINKIANIVQNITLCQGDSLSVGDTIYYEDGVYIDTLASIAGCDSIIMTDLRVLNTFYQYDFYNGCAGDTIFANNTIYTKTGIYQDTFKTIFGCDSIIVSDIKLANPVVSENIFLCAGDSLVVGGNAITVAGAYTFLFTSSLGCDSLHTFNLAYYPAQKKEQTFTICPGDSVLVDGKYYKTPGIFIDSFQNIYGCDSVLITKINFDNVATNINLNLCEGSRVVVNGITYESGGNFRDTLQRANGCDSILIIRIDLWPTFVRNDSFEICKGGSVKVGNSVYFNAGDYSEYLTTVNGCDSLILAHIEEIDFNVDIAISKDSLEAPDYPEAVYTWLRCYPSFSDIIGETTDPYFVITQNGTYQVRIRYKGCSYYSDCKPFVITSLDDISDNTRPFLYPNPVSESVRLHGVHQEGIIRLFNTDGRMVLKAQADPTHSVDVRGIPAGVYTFVFTYGNGNKIALPFVKY